MLLDFALIACSAFGCDVVLMCLDFDSWCACAFFCFGTCGWFWLCVCYFALGMVMVGLYGFVILCLYVGYDRLLFGLIGVLWNYMVCCRC